MLVFVRIWFSAAAILKLKLTPGLTCGIRLAVVRPAVFQLDRGQAEGLHHLVRSLAPIGGAERQDGQGEGQ